MSEDHPHECYENELLVNKRPFTVALDEFTVPFPFGFGIPLCDLKTLLDRNNRGTNIQRDKRTNDQMARASGSFRPGE